MTDSYSGISKNKLTESEVRWRQSMDRLCKKEEKPLETVEIIVGSQGSITIKPIDSDSPPSPPQPT